MANFKEQWILNGKSIRNLGQLASGANAATITAKVNALLTALENSNLMFAPYNINYNLTRVTETSQPTSIADDVALSINLANATGYVMPDAVKVLCDGKELAAAKVTYTRTSDNAGTIAVAADDIKGDIEIIAVGGYKLTQTLTATTSSVSNTVHLVDVGADFEATYTAGAGKTLPSTIAVTEGGETLTVDTDYTWDDETGKLIIPEVAGALVITITST